MLNATAVILLFPPHIDLNTSLKDRFDLLTGMASDFHVGLIRDLDMSLTLVPSYSIGICNHEPVNQRSVCSGSKKVLADGAADFSMNGLALRSYYTGSGQPLQLMTPSVPLFSTESSIVASPDSEAESRSFDMVDGLYSIHGIVSLTIVFLTIAVFLINRSFCQRFYRKLSFAAIAQMLSLSSNWQFRQTRRRILVASCLFLVFAFQQAFIASLHSSLVLEIPAKYPVSLTHVADSNRRTLFAGGLGIEASFAGSEDPIKRKIAERAMTVDMAKGHGLWRMATTLLTDKPVTLVEASLLRDLLAVIVCMQSDYSKCHDFRFSEPFADYTTYLVCKPRVRPQVKQRVTDVFGRYFETGLFHKYMNDPFEPMKTMIDVRKAIRCYHSFLMMSGGQSESSTGVETVHVRSFGVVIFVLASVLITAAAVCVCECFLWNVRRKRMIGVGKSSSVKNGDDRRDKADKANSARRVQQQTTPAPPAPPSPPTGAAAKRLGSDRPITQSPRKLEK